MNKAQSAALDDLVGQTQAYVDSIKRLSNLSAIDVSDLEGDTQSRWIWRVDNEISVAVRAVVKLGGPNNSTLMLPCQRPELRGLYVKYELLKASISGVVYKPETSSQFIEEAEPAPGMCVTAEGPTSKSSEGSHKTRKHGKRHKSKASAADSGVVLPDEGTDDPPQTDAPKNRSFTGI